MMYQGSLKPPVESFRSYFTSLLIMILVMSVAVPLMMFLFERAIRIYEQEQLERDRQAVILAIGALRQAEE